MRWRHQCELPVRSSAGRLGKRVLARLRDVLNSDSVNWLRGYGFQSSDFIVQVMYSVCVGFRLSF